MNPFQQGIHTFHTTYGVPAADSPRPLPQDRVDLRIGLIHEEFIEELVPALHAGDIVETVDAAIDIIYVTLGLLVEMGVDAEPIFDEVQRSNMSKLGADGKPIYREDGKVLKGPNYFTPDIRARLLEQGAIL